MSSLTFRTVFHGFRATAIPRNILRNPATICARSLYSAHSLGLDRFNEDRQRVFAHLGPRKAEYFSQFWESFKEDRKSSETMVFTGDLKNVVQLSETDEDIELCIRMMRIFHKQNQDLRFGTFSFGPVVLRLLYVLDKPDVVIQVLKDPELHGFFDQTASYQLAMDLLYKRARYQEVIDLFEHMRSRQVFGTRFPRDCVVLVLGACYQLGTRGAYDFALKLVAEGRESGARILRKGLTFTAALALKMQEPKVAMELLALTAQMNYISVRNLRLIALSHMDLYEEIFLVLRSIVHQYHHLRHDHSGICPDTIDRIRENLEKKGDPERLQLFSQLQRALKEGNHISEDSLDEVLERPMEHKSRDTNPPLAMFKERTIRPPPSLRPRSPPSDVGSSSKD
ncbi:pentatricopeptide repeat-containing protein 2, mitochondrial [Galendromus occidentalis]|uniref:Pentatricopeptide repeat-containing protein 2, mitochondrial n=1 Tax=Galendromus occidentalis TaxID=34638 RepID=A0AAJ6VWR4_9ACAR|nr:pentatricopeptide repeat-containing protein 2, mitochondrial [Galendromus occidentalis]